MTRVFLCVAVCALNLSCGVGVLEDEATVLNGVTDSLVITSPLTLSSTAIESGATLTASVTYTNMGAAPVLVARLAIESRPQTSDVRDVLSPTAGEISVAPQGTITVVASRTFTDDDAEGTWEAYSSLQDTNGRSSEGPHLEFHHHRRSPDAGAPSHDAGTPSHDAGTPSHDAGTPSHDAGTPSHDAGTPSHDAGTTPPPVDAGVSGDAGEPPSVDAGALVEPVNPGASDVTFTIRADLDRHAISPLIYGINQVTNLATTQRGVGLVRAGGNRWTAYNWENNASNAGIDYLNENDNYLVMNLSNPDAPGEAVRARAANALANGASTLVTIPMQGYVAADKLGNGDVNQSANYLQTRFKQTVSTKGAAFTLTPNTSDGVVYQDEFVNWLNTQFPTAFAAVSPKILFTLDNEPDLWSDSHPRIQPAMVTAATLIAKNIEFAKAVKSIIPTATITGFVSYGYYGFMALQGNYSGDFTAYYLDQMRQAEASEHRRLIDVLDLHWYPEATGDGQRIIGTSTSAGSVAARVQAPRSLWDSTYRETSWVANAEGGPIQLIPKMKARIAAHYPGTKLGFTEYSYGGGADISGAIAEADVLGIFGREDVYLANFWDLAGSASMVYAGMRTFTSYDEAGAHFGDTSIRATTSNAASTSVYASIDAAQPGRMVIVAINKTSAPITASLSLAAYGTYTSANVYRLTSASSTIAKGSTVSASTRNGFFYQMPAYSVSVLVPQ